MLQSWGWNEQRSRERGWRRKGTFQIDSGFLHNVGAGQSAMAGAGRDGERHSNDASAGGTVSAKEAERTMWARWE